jgi:hypothetical protein
VRTLHGGLSVDLRDGEPTALVLAQGSERVSVEMAGVKVVAAETVDAAADLVEALAEEAEGAGRRGEE